MAGNSNLHMSKDAKEDEYYTSIQTTCIDKIV